MPGMIGNSQFAPSEVRSLTWVASLTEFTLRYRYELTAVTVTGSKSAVIFMAGRMKRSLCGWANGA